MSLQESNCEGGDGKGRGEEPGQAENHKNNKQIISFYHMFIYYLIYLKPEPAENYYC